jgi:hypothetical protein
VWTRRRRSDEVGGIFDVEPPLGVGRRADSQALDAGSSQAEGSWPASTTAVRRSTPRSDCCANSSDLAFLRIELAQLMRLHPQDAERLRIPVSVETIDDRLSAATDDR